MIQRAITRYVPGHAETYHEVAQNLQNQIQEIMNHFVPTGMGLPNVIITPELEQGTTLGFYVTVIYNGE